MTQWAKCYLTLTFYLPLLAVMSPDCRKCKGLWGDDPTLATESQTDL